MLSNHIYICHFVISCSTVCFDQSPEKGTDKARLLARMSKMGKNPLSLPGAVAAEPEEDDMGEQVRTVKLLKTL